LDCQLIVGSILDRDLVREAMKGVDFVFHLAAMVSVQESMQKPNKCAEINIRGTAIVLEAAARARVKKLIFSSSAAIYGDSPTIPKIESMPAEPRSPYATSKYEAERHCRSFTDEGRLSTFSLKKDLAAIERGRHV
jgi:UDP-glucose 4-epimerase